MSLHTGIGRCNLIPVCPCLQAPSLSKRLVLSSRSSKLGHRLVFNGSNCAVRVPKLVFRKNWIQRVIASAEQDHIGEGEANEETNGTLDLLECNNVAPELQPKASKLKKRVISGLAIGLSVGGIVLAGGWIFTFSLAAAVYLGLREYFELVRSRGITAGMISPPRYLSRVCSVMCALMPILTLYFGNIDVSVTSAAFVVAAALLLQRGNPHFAQLSSTVFGLFYCGYLPCFWVKLRCILAVPALLTSGILDRADSYIFTGALASCVFLCQNIPTSFRSLRL